MVSDNGRINLKYFTVIEFSKRGYEVFSCPNYLIL